MVEQRYIDGYLKQGFAKAKKVVSKDWDWVTLIDGTEGAGKSVMAQQCANEVDPNISIERITFTPEEFTEAIYKAQKNQAVIYDEAYTGLSSRGAMSDINKTLIQMLAEIRQKNLFVFIVMPTFFDLDKHAAIWRSRGLIHVYTDKDYERGRFAYYNKDKKKLLYILGKKYYDYSRPKPSFRGRFLGYYIVDEQQYRAKKLAALTADKQEDTKDYKLATTLKVLTKHISLREAAKELTEAGYKTSHEHIRQLIEKHIGK